MGLAHVGQSIVRAVFYYQTQKVVYLESIKLGIIYRLVQLAIVAYIVGFAIVYKKGYQDTEDAVSVVTAKVKGLAFTHEKLGLPRPYNGRIWDTADYVIPPQENGAVFVMTNAIITKHQTQGNCTDDPNVSRNCSSDNDCTWGATERNGNGVQNGKCNSTSKTCEVYAWCPVEVDHLAPQLKNQPLLQAENFTILIKNFIDFRKFNVKRRNILESSDQSHLQSCIYHPTDDPYCPVFRVSDMVKLADSDWQHLVIRGGVIGVNINWNCDLDHSYKECRPSYSFNRLDDENTKLAPGWNFRYANYYTENYVDYRDLYKAYGILFALSVRATAGKFSIVPLVLNIGSGLALLSLASVVCDLILLHIHNKRKFYHEQKFVKVKDDEEAGGSNFGNENRNEALSSEMKGNVKTKEK